MRSSLLPALRHCRELHLTDSMYRRLPAAGLGASASQDGRQISFHAVGRGGSLGMLRANCKDDRSCCATNRAARHQITALQLTTHASVAVPMFCAASHVNHSPRRRPNPLPPTRGGCGHQAMPGQLVHVVGQAIVLNNLQQRNGASHAAVVPRPWC